MLDATTMRRYCMHVMNEQRKNAEKRQPTPEQLVGRQVRLLRQVRNWSQLEVAEKMQAYGYQWSQATVARLEAATRPIRLNELPDLAALFGIPVRQFLDIQGTDFEFDDLDALRREITSLEGKHAELQKDLQGAQAAAQTAHEAMNTIAMEVAYVAWRLETLKNWAAQPPVPSLGSAAGEDGQ